MGTNLELEADEACASLGIATVDDVKLKYVVMVAVISCIVAALAARKIKRSSSDKALFTQPGISYLGECPICFLPLSIDLKKSTRMSCCSKWICNGCFYANKKRENERGLQQRCVYCRNPEPKSQEEVEKNIMKRIKKNDPVAMRHKGKEYARKGDYGKALEFHSKAAELGDVEAHACLGTLYERGLGVEKDMKKAVYHYEKAAIGGNPQARGLLGGCEMKNGRVDRAVKHFIIAANLGCDLSLKAIKAIFVAGVASEEDYAAALRGYQAAVDATKSPEREEAEEAMKNGRRRSVF